MTRSDLVLLPLEVILLELADVFLAPPLVEAGQLELIAIMQQSVELAVEVAGDLEQQLLILVDPGPLDGLQGVVEDNLLVFLRGGDGVGHGPGVKSLGSSAKLQVSIKF